jgi:hypothetical protein
MGKTPAKVNPAADDHPLTLCNYPQSREDQSRAYNCHYDHSRAGDTPCSRGHQFVKYWQMNDVSKTASASSGLRRWAPLGVLITLAGLIFASGLTNYLSFQAIAENHEMLKEYVASHLALSLLIYALLYVSVVALSVPGAAVLSIAGGFLFGWLLSGTVTILAATIGASIVFQVVKTSLQLRALPQAGARSSILRSERRRRSRACQLQLICVGDIGRHHTRQLRFCLARSRP